MRLYLVAPQAASAIDAHGRGGRVAASRLGAHEGVRAAAEHTLAPTPDRKENNYQICTTLRHFPGRLT